MMGLMEFFDAVYISSDCMVKKPQPEFMRRLLNEQGLDADRTVMTGNEIASDLGVAAECGIDGILLNTGNLTDDMIRDELNKLTKTGQMTTGDKSGAKKNDQKTAPDHLHNEYCESMSRSLAGISSRQMIIRSGDIRELPDLCIG
jgi:FMN phosphatase YigB (HAD superfamily)